MAELGAVEVERKYEADPSAPAPPLESLPGVLKISPPAEHRLGATYYDTAELSLATQGITLRRRTGGADAGWHLKLPVGSDRRM